ncbi:MAG: hypothetical protein ABI867_13410 [Kofleriaceae bacterium]
MKAVLLVLAACGGSGGAGDDDVSIDAPADAAPIACSCTYGQPHTAGAVADNAAKELSGLAASRTTTNVLWTHNDSGDGPRLFAVGNDGANLGEATLTGATATDWEDIATAPCGDHQCLYIGDHGDNDLARASVRIYEVDEPAIAEDMTPTFRAFDIAYPDGKHNAEALFVDPRDGASYVITKQPTNPSRVFHMPRTDGQVATAVAIGALAIPSGNLLVTGADLHADACGIALLVRTYSALFELRAGPAATIPELLAAPLRQVPVAAEAQGEAIAWRVDGTGYVTVSEGNSAVLAETSCQ